jgi:hypothetical protein
VPPNPINLYGLKRASDDIAELAKVVGAEKIILGGHDWCVISMCLLRLRHTSLILLLTLTHRGGFVVWRAAQW